MKINKLRCKPASIADTRWASYAAAGAATALAGSNSAEGAIHYSGRLDVLFSCQSQSCRTTHTFQLDQPGDSFVLAHYVNSYHHGPAYFGIGGIASAAFRGRQGQLSIRHYVSRLSSGERVSRGPFSLAGFGLLVYSGGDHSQWKNGGYGSIGFSFNNGAGVQYGWARIRITGSRRDSIFWLVDYAYADVGEPIRAGQTSSGEQAPDQGSLGWLALGAVGLLAWRKSRKSLTARLEDA